MSKSKIRNDKTCLNCRYVVENKFCPNCGQENTDTRKTFHHLFTHFFEDLTHYENAFWRTIKNLLFKPAALTKEYLSGKRLSYLAPVRLYIFISFITFLLIAIFPSANNSSDKTLENKSIITTKSKAFQNTITKNDSVKNNQTYSKEEKDSIKNNIAVVDEEYFSYKSVRELDSIQKHAPESEKLSDFSYWANRKVQIVIDNNPKGDLFKKFTESFIHNFSKVLFIFMPIFAFSLWLFHNKKRWYYFDHGIFTLHYFSFLLLLFLLLFLINKVLTPFSESSLISFIQIVINFIGIGWMIYYFYPAHHRFYGETRIISFIKSSLLFFINFLLIIIILSIFAIYTFINLH